MNQTIYQAIINFISSHTMSVPRYLSPLAIVSWLIQDNPLNLGDLGDDISTIDPFS